MAATTNGPVIDRQQLQALADSVDFWWHSIDLGQGVLTKGQKTHEELREELASLRLPDLKGKNVIDIGAYDGYYSFAAERLGAVRVVALDHYVWALDMPRHFAAWRESKRTGAVLAQPEDTDLWQPDLLPGKRPFDIAHRVLGSRVEVVVDDFMKMDLAPLGKFDVCLFLGVLYHMKDPLGSLERLASVTGELAVIESLAIYVPGYEHSEMVEFYSSNQVNADPSNWWGPNAGALVGMCLAAGFSRVEVLRAPVTPSRAVRRAAGLALALLQRKPRYYRVVVHAWK